MGAALSGGRPHVSRRLRYTSPGDSLAGTLGVPIMKVVINWYVGFTLGPFLHGIPTCKCGLIRTWPTRHIQIVLPPAIFPDRTEKSV